MKVLCPHCERLISLDVFRVDGPALIITCTRCGAESRVENVSATAAVASVSNAPSPRAAPASLPPRVSLASTDGGSNVVVLRTAGHEAVQKAAKVAEEDPFAVPASACPKCIGPRSSAPSCPHCGIRYESFDESTVLIPKWLRQEWVELLRDWGNDAKHSQLRRKAQQLDGLASLGRLYRMRQTAVPEDPVASEGRADVLRLAAVVINLRPATADEGARRKRVMLISLGIVGAAWLLGLLLLALRS